ncbi:MAG: dockerin type I domain-containing protein [Candidatus Zixiibacteriota bacterium]
MNKKICLIMVFALAIVGVSQSSGAIIADHSAVTEFSSIPIEVINEIQSQYQFFYGHTSHGSQIVTGLYMLEQENSLYTPPSIAEYGDDLGGTGDTSWAPITRNFLNANPGTDVVIWSWCGGVTDITADGINLYLNTYHQLEIDYPTVTFIYMTGHLDGSGVDGNLNQMNNLIRAYCINNDRVLFDFADIESYDPDGIFYPDETDACYWCADWCDSHACPSCVDCAHSHCFNCYQKGKAFWWMMAKVTGWDVESGGCGDVDNSGTVNILDITFLINHLYKSGPAPQPLEIGDVNNSGVINILDITTLISYLYKSGPDLNCPE